MLQDGVLAFALLGAEWVLWVLVGLSVAVAALSAERVFYLTRDGTDRATLVRLINTFLAGGDVNALRSGLASADGFEARVLKAGLELAPYGTAAVERAFHGTVTAEKLRMERGLALLATTGSNAPFVGLFGTVLGIIKAFNDLAKSQAEASEAVMAGISEALVATAVGLIVAIPAVVLFNVFNRWVRARLARTESITELVLARLSGRDIAEGD